MRSALSRIGAAGLIFIVALVFFAFLAGGIVAHRLSSSNSAVVQQQGEQAGDHQAGEKNGDQQAGDQQAGDQQAGDQQAGDQQGDQKDQGEGQSKASGSRETSPESD